MKTETRVINLDKCKHCLCNINQGISWCELGVKLFPDRCNLCEDFEKDVIVQTVTATSINFSNTPKNNKK